MFIPTPKDIYGSAIKKLENDIALFCMLKINYIGSVCLVDQPFIICLLNTGSTGVMIQN